VLGWHFSLRPGTVGLAQWHSSLAGPRQPELRARWHGAQLRRRPRCSASSGDSTGERRWLHRRRPAVVGHRKRPDATAFQGDGGAPVAGEDVDESCSWRRGCGRRGVVQKGRTMGAWWSPPRGGGRWRSGGRREDERERIEGRDGDVTRSGGRVTGGATRR
jgi:hypothetical protein